MRKKEKSRGKRKLTGIILSVLFTLIVPIGIRISYGTAVRKLSGTVFLYQTDLSCLRGTRDRGHLYDHLSDRTLREPMGDRVWSCLLTLRNS